MIMKSYRNFYKTVHTDQRAFFIGANTKDGFTFADRQLFDESRFESFYIIKGGPGTGKSSLMKALRHHFKKIGAHITSYYCSSDPDSLDALIISKDGKAIAVADGTAPHVFEAQLPGVSSQIVNLGDLWDREKLIENRQHIASLSADKAICFSNAKKFISAADGIAKVLRDSATGGFQKEKAERAIKRSICALPRPIGTPAETTVITEAISMNGAVRLDTLEQAGTVIRIEDHFYLLPLYMELLRSKLIESGYSLYTSRSPLGDICEIYLPNEDIAFIGAGEGCRCEKTIRLSRFAENEYFSNKTAKRHFNEKCLMECLECALDHLAMAREHHFALEEIYKSAMDFKRVDNILLYLKQEIGNSIQ